MVIKKAEAKRAVIREWDVWSRNYFAGEAKGADGLSFFTYLQRENPSLLEFRSSGDKWQVVRGWLVQARRVKD